MRLVHWFFRRNTADAGQCRHCRSPLDVCDACDGAWQGRGCGCGIGRLCPRCGRHWV